MQYAITKWCVRHVLGRAENGISVALIVLELYSDLNGKHSFIIYSEGTFSCELWDLDILS